MVNRGQPSRDCQPCKKRKLRCDLQRERCGQCRRANIACFGWPDLNALIIRDETASAQRKVLARTGLRGSAPSGQYHSSDPSSRPSPSSNSSITSYPSSVSTTNPSPQMTRALVSIGGVELPAATISNHIGRVPFEDDKIPTPLSFAWEVRARNAFFSHYVFGFSRSHDALSQLYAASSATSVLSAAVDAAALAFLAKQHEAPGHVTVHSTPGSSELVSLTSRSYIVAIKRLSTILDAAARGQDEVFGTRPHEEARGDATLQAVLLLDLCEKLACVGRRPDRTSYPGLQEDNDSNNNNNNGTITEDPWMSHLRGALELVRIRGLKRRYSSPTARRLAARLTMTLVISCGVAGVHVPQELEELRMGLSPHLDILPQIEDRGAIKAWNPDDTRVDPKFAVTSLVIGVVNLVADLSQGKRLPPDLFRQAKELDNRLAAMERELPSSWQCERICTEEGSPVVYGDHYDMYVDHFVTQVRNVIRSMRLLLLEMIQKHCRVHEDVDDYRTRTARLIDSLCGNICAAVPQFVWPQARSENCIPFTPLQSLQCYTLLSPLYLAAKLSTRVKMRAWIIGTLQYMAGFGGMKAANSIARILQSHPDVSYWQVYAMLGSYAFAA
ncbi:putative Zn(2)-C6 fungal-type domain-containing protein [Seiridium cardinale]|uniref:Zn(2)-C6 fungal-type domain-containing protein n=1 Tax=Seiridium cardinale TaxID=138064 RepID=A0ABR2XTT2_9PEZI